MCSFLNSIRSCKQVVVMYEKFHDGDIILSYFKHRHIYVNFLCWWVNHNDVILDPQEPRRMHAEEPQILRGTRCEVDGIQAKIGLLKNGFDGRRRYNQVCCLIDKSRNNLGSTLGIQLSSHKLKENLFQEDKFLEILFINVKN